MGWGGKADNIRPLVSCQMLLDKDIMFLSDVNTNSRIGSQDGSNTVIRCFFVKFVSWCNFCGVVTRLSGSFYNTVSIHAKSSILFTMSFCVIFCEAAKITALNGVLVLRYWLPDSVLIGFIRCFRASTFIEVLSVGETWGIHLKWKLLDLGCNKVPLTQKTEGKVFVNSSFSAVPLTMTSPWAS